MNSWQEEYRDDFSKKPMVQLCKTDAIKKDCRSILLADRLEAIGYKLYRDTFGYKVKKNEIEIIVKNLDKLELLLNILEKQLPENKTHYQQYVKRIYADNLCKMIKIIENNK